MGARIPRGTGIFPDEFGANAESGEGPGRARLMTQGRLVMNRIRIRRPRARALSPHPQDPDIVRAKGARADRAFRKGARDMMAWVGRRLWLAAWTMIRAVRMAHHEQVSAARAGTTSTRPLNTSLCQSSRPRPPRQPARQRLRTFNAHHRTPEGREKDHNTADMGQLPAGPAVPVGLGWHPAADDLAAAHAYLPARAALATDGEPETGPGHHLSGAGGPAKNHPPARRASGVSQVWSQPCTVARTPGIVITGRSARPSRMRSKQARTPRPPS